MHWSAPNEKTMSLGLTVGNWWSVLARATSPHSLPFYNITVPSPSRWCSWRPWRFKLLALLAVDSCRPEDWNFAPLAVILTGPRQERIKICDVFDVKAKKFAVRRSAAGTGCFWPFYCGRSGASRAIAGSERLSGANSLRAAQARRPGDCPSASPRSQLSVEDQRPALSVLRQVPPEIMEKPITGFDRSLAAG